MSHYIGLAVILLAGIGACLTIVPTFELHILGLLLYGFGFWLLGRYIK